MIKELLAQTAALNLEIFGQVLFLAVFLAVLAWIFRSSGKSYYNRIQNLPFEGEG